MAMQSFTNFDVSHRQRELLLAQNRAEELFAAIEARQLIRSGVTEKQVNDEIYDLAFELFGIRKFWHKRIVRAGANTLCPYRENPPELEIQKDDIVFLDFGPIFEDWEADLGRTYVLGNDATKLRLKADVESIWAQGKDHFDQNPNIRASELFTFVVGKAESLGWTFGQEHCGHLIGNFPHENIRRDEAHNFIHPNNDSVMRESDPNGIPRDWILEVHCIDKQREIGSFFEQLLLVG